MASGCFDGLTTTDEVEIFDPELGEKMWEGKSGMASVVVDRGIRGRILQYKF